MASSAAPAMRPINIASVEACSNPNRIANGTTGRIRRQSPVAASTNAVVARNSFGLLACMGRSTPLIHSEERAILQAYSIQTVRARGTVVLPLKPGWPPYKVWLGCARGRCRLLADAVEKGFDSIVVWLDAAFDGRRRGCVRRR